MTTLTFAHLSDHMTVRYDVGNEYSADSPLGRTELQLTPDGRARLDLVRFGRRATWTADVDISTVNGIREALQASPFPQTPEEPWTAGSAGREVHVTAPEHEDAHAVVEWHVGARLAGYKEVFALLDVIVDQMRGARTGNAAPSVIVSDLRMIYDGEDTRDRSY